MNTPVAAVITEKNEKPTKAAMTMVQPRCHSCAAVSLGSTISAPPHPAFGWSNRSRDIVQREAACGSCLIFLIHLPSSRRGAMFARTAQHEDPRSMASTLTQTAEKLELTPPDP